MDPEPALPSPLSFLRRKAAGDASALEALYDAYAARVNAVAQAQTQQRIIAALSAPDAQAVTLTGQGGATARVAYRPGATEAVFQARGLPALPTNQTYQLWLFAASGKPLPSITFADANAGLPIAAAQEFARFINFAISIEPAGGSAAPTGPIVLIAKG